jgi:hypothetical protein
MVSQREGEGTDCRQRMDCNRTQGEGEEQCKMHVGNSNYIQTKQREEIELQILHIWRLMTRDGKLGSK